MIFIAHRGASAHAPENTLASFQLALEMGATRFELDIHRTSDAQIVVLHDDNLKRFKGPRRKVKDMTYRELSAHDVGSWFDREFSAERVPLLSDVMDLLGEDAWLNVEVKGGGRVYPGLEEQLLAFLKRKTGWRERVVISSFDHPSLFKLRSLDSGLSLGYLAGSTRYGRVFEEMEQLRCESLHLGLRQVSRRWVEAAHAKKHKVLVYTVDSPEDIQKLEKMGVDGVFTNCPELGVAGWAVVGGTN